MIVRQLVNATGLDLLFRCCDAMLPGLEQRVRRCADLPFLVRVAVSAYPLQLFVANHGDADSSNLELRHASRKRYRSAVFTAYDNERTGRPIN